MIDTHAHLDMLKSENDLYESIEKLDYIITIGCDKKEIYKAVELTKLFDNVYGAVGFHPYDVREITDKEITELVSIIQNNPKIVAVGETGLDYYRDITPKKIQWKYFEAQINLSKELGLPLIIHSRNADEDTIKILEDNAPFKVGGVMHCFGGSIILMERAVELGFYISFAGNITYPKANKLREIMKKTPLNRLLLETDSPFLSPQQKRGKPNKPSYIFYTLEFVSKELDISPSELEQVLDKNALRLFSKIGKSAVV